MMIILLYSCQPQKVLFDYSSNLATAVTILPYAIYHTIYDVHIVQYTFIIMIYTVSTLYIVLILYKYTHYKPLNLYVIRLSNNNNPTEYYYRTDNKTGQGV